MTRKLIGKKRGMTQVFDKEGNVVPCTVIECEKNVVVQIKNREIEGYNAIQIGCEIIKAKDPRRKEARTKKPLFGHFKKAGVEPRKHLVESRLESVEGLEPGQEFGVEIFNEIAFVDVTGTSKGKGYQGVMKLFNFRGGPAAHGSKFHRHHGSTGMRTTPGRCFPGGRRAGHMGDRRVTVQNMRVVQVHEESNIILVRGAVPGPVDGLVYISEAVKKPSASV